VAESIHAAGADVLYLPPYGPAFTIELMWSKMRAILRKMKIRSRDLLDNAMADALTSVTSSDISGRFKHDEYCLC
jgi:hypothetical protein